MYKIVFLDCEKNPFLTPIRIPGICFWTREIQEALAGLAYGIKNRKGFILLTGEVGTGKTTLAKSLAGLAKIWKGSRLPTFFKLSARYQPALRLHDGGFSGIPCREPRTRAMC